MTLNAPAPKRTLYQLAAVLDFANHSVAVKEKITYRNLNSEPVSDLLIVIQANREPEYFHLASIYWRDGSLVSDYQWEGHNIFLNLPVPLQPLEVLTIGLDYSLDLTSKLFFPGYTARQINLADWYPFIPPYMPGSGWIAHDPAEVGENLAYDISDFDIRLQIADPDKDISICASAPPIIKNGVYQFTANGRRNFSISLSKYYQQLVDKVGDISISMCVFPENIEAGRFVLENVKKALDFYGRAFGQYKNTTMTVVESEVPDGMEYDGLFFFGQEYFEDFTGSTQSYLVSLSVHETAHQWWYASVGNDPATEPWLDESLSTYSELLFYEHYYPTDVTWWWDYRINRFRPEGFVNTTIYDYQSFRPYVDAVYLRGAEFLDIVRGQMGSNNFMSFVYGYAKLYADRISTTRLFFDYLSSASRFDLQLTRAAFFK